MASFWKSDPGYRMSMKERAYIAITFITAGFIYGICYLAIVDPLFTWCIFAAIASVFGIVFSFEPNSWNPVRAILIMIIIGLVLFLTAKVSWLY